MLKKKHIKKKDTYTQVIYVQLKPTFALKEKKKKKRVIQWLVQCNKRKQYKKILKSCKTITIISKKQYKLIF